MAEKTQSVAALNEVVTEHPVLDPLTKVSYRRGNDDLAERLIELRQWLNDDLTDLEELITNFTEHGQQEDSHLGWQAASHLLERPGKRIRPMCVLLAARLGGLPMTKAVRNVAVACEMVHAATLLHDDVIDEGTERRGHTASRLVYGNSASILAGDQLFVEALRLVEQTGRMDLLSSLLGVISEMIAAEALQLERRGRFKPDRQAYLDVLHGKTAALFRWGLRAGGALAGLSEEELQTLGRIGDNLGIAFQLIDDLIDLDGDPETTGKDALADLRQGKMTWPFLLACEESEEIRTELYGLVSGEVALEDADLPALIQNIRDCGAIEGTRQFACQQGDDADRDLEKLPAGRARQALELVIQTAIKRAR
jgi:octaprenyl-diphosphate synthase